MSKSSEGSSPFSWFLAGLGLGSLLGVLYAPRPGQQTREELMETALGSTEYVRQRSREATRTAAEYAARTKEQAAQYAAQGKEQASQYVNVGKEQASTLVGAAKEQAGSLVGTAKETIETGRQKINDTYTQGVQAVAEQKEKLAASFEAGKQAYNETTVAPLPKQIVIPGTETLS